MASPFMYCVFHPILGHHDQMLTIAVMNFVRCVNCFNNVWIVQVLCFLVCLNFVNLVDFDKFSNFGECVNCVALQGTAVELIDRVQLVKSTPCKKFSTPCKGN